MDADLAPSVTESRKYVLREHPGIAPRYVKVALIHQSQESVVKRETVLFGSYILRQCRIVNGDGELYLVDYNVASTAFRRYDFSEIFIQKQGVTVLCVRNPIEREVDNVIS